MAPAVEAGFAGLAQAPGASGESGSRSRRWRRRRPPRRPRNRQRRARPGVPRFPPRASRQGYPDAEARRAPSASVDSKSMSVPESSSRRALLAALEVVASIAVATALVALLEPATPASGLGAIYLLAVLFVAIRRGLLAALAAAALAALTFNFFFIEPLHRLTIGRSEDVIALVVLLIAALVVGRLAATARDRAARGARARGRGASPRARVADPRRRRGLRPPGRRPGGAAGEPGGRGRGQLGGHAAPRPAGEPRRTRWRGRDPGAVGDQAGVALRRLPRLDADGARALRRPAREALDVAVEGARAAAQAAEAEAATPSRRREDGRPPRDLARSPLPADRRSARPPARFADGSSRRPRTSSSASSRTSRAASRASSTTCSTSRGSRPARSSRGSTGATSRRSSGAPRRRSSGDAAARSSIDLPASLPLIQADPAQLERVFANLLDNAVRFSPPGTSARVTAGSGAGKVTIRVIDRGPGMPTLAARDRVRAVLPRPPDAGEGSGLGLAICRGFVEANGGEISLQRGSERGNRVRGPLSARRAAGIRRVSERGQQRARRRRRAADPSRPPRDPLRRRIPGADRRDQAGGARRAGGPRPPTPWCST